MQLILAIDSDPRRSEQLATLVRSRLQVDLVQATSAGEGLHALRDRVPDLILTSPLLSPFDDGVLDEYLRDLGSAATHVQTVRIPMLSSGPKKKSAATRLFSLGRKKTQTSPASPDGCDPKVFADEIAHYLTRSLEGRSSSSKAVEVQAAPARVPATEKGPLAQLLQEWTAPEAMVQEFPETTPAAWRAEALANAAPEPVVADRHMPGSILDLRTPITHGPAPVVAAEPESYAFIEPDPVVEPEPIAQEFAEPEPFDVAQGRPFDVAQGRPFDVAEDIPVEVAQDISLDLAQDETVDLAQGEPFDFAESEPVLVEPEPVAYVEPAPPVIAPRVIAQPAAPVTQTPAPATGNSASFEAALAAIRAAWVKPESTPPPPAAPPSAAAVKPAAGSGEVDLTNEIDALEDVTGADGSTPAAEADAEDANTSKARRKTDKPGKRPEKPRGRKAAGPDDRNDRSDGRNDWGVFDPSQYEFSALVNKLDEVTESDEVTTRATNRR